MIIRILGGIARCRFFFPCQVGREEATTRGVKKNKPRKEACRADSEKYPGSICLFPKMLGEKEKEAQDLHIMYCTPIVPMVPNPFKIFWLFSQGTRDG